ncbi:MAG: thiamine phosphate synthase [Nitrospirota bacterium]|nr:thiamine phosphate synthase [Nitrospirota bacterium]
MADSTHNRKKRLLAVRGVYLIADAATLSGPPLVAAVSAAVAAGVGVVQYRDKSTAPSQLTRALLQQARAVCRAARSGGALFLVNDRADVALLVDADGLHVGQDDLPLNEARALLGADALLGVSTHDVAEARRAQAEGADYIGFGNVFGTVTKADVTPAQGVAALAAGCRAVQLPVFAIGGVGQSNLALVRAAGAAGGAVVSALLRATDPAQAARDLLAAWGE